MLKNVSGFMLENAITKISKKYAMNLGSKAWIEGILNKTKNIDSGFRAAGIFLLSFSTMQRRLKIFKDGGIADSEKNTTWMRCREIVRTEVLSPTPEIDRRIQRRWTIDVNNWLLSIEH